MFNNYLYYVRKSNIIYGCKYVREYMLNNRESVLLYQEEFKFKSMFQSAVFPKKKKNNK